LSIYFVTYFKSFHCIKLNINATVTKCQGWKKAPKPKIAMEKCNLGVDQDRTRDDDVTRLLSCARNDEKIVTVNNNGPGSVAWKIPTTLVNEAEAGQ